MINVAGKNLYLSGPMTSVHNNGAAAFADAHATLKQMGAKRIYDPAYEWLKEPSGEKHDHEYYMRKCIWELVRTDNNDKPLYDAIVLLDGWDNSEGCHTEVNVAYACGIPIMMLSDIIDTEKHDKPEVADECCGDCCGCCDCCDDEDDGIPLGDFLKAIAMAIIDAVEDEDE